MWAPCRASAGEVKQFTSITRSELAAVKAGVLWSQPIGMPGTDGRHGQDGQETWPVFRTGDLGRITKHGLELLGRTDNEVKIGGEQCVSNTCALLHAAQDVSTVSAPPRS